jgi:glycosyltransferase involved in cell wall biosynthesis
MDKKVCHITSAHSRYDVRIFVKECTSLSKNGYNVMLIVNDKLPDEVKKGVNIISTKFDPKNRIERFLKSGKLLLNKAIEVDADIYHLHDPDLLPVGNKLREMGKKVIFDSHEDVPKQIMDKYWIPKLFRKFISGLYSKYEKFSLRKYTAVVTVTPHIVERLSKINPNTVMVTNYPIVDSKDIIKKKSDGNSICFAGGISSEWNHDKIIKAIENIDEIKYILAGKEVNNYIHYLSSLPAWYKVEYVGMIPHDKVKDIYSKSIAGMALSYSIQGKEEGTLGNTKLFEFMAAGLPVICSDYRLWKKIIEENNCGICIDPNNIDEIAKSIRYILDNPEEAKKMGENGRKAVVEKYNWGVQEKVLLGLYEKI